MTAARPRPIPQEQPARPDAEREARAVCRDAIAQAKRNWESLSEILPANRWRIIERDGMADPKGDPEVERVKAHRVVLLINMTRKEQRQDGIVDPRLREAAEKQKVVLAAFNALAEARRKQGRY